MSYKDELKQMKKKQNRANFYGKIMLYIVGIILIFFIINYLENHQLFDKVNSSKNTQKVENVKTDK